MKKKQQKTKKKNNKKKKNMTNLIHIEFKGYEGSVSTNITNFILNHQNSYPLLSPNFLPESPTAAFCILGVGCGDNNVVGEREDYLFQKHINQKKQKALG